jgi:hypothetical protein
VSINRDVVLDLINYKLHRIQQLIQVILTRWEVLDASKLLEDSKLDKYPESENDAIDLKQ